MSGGDKPGVSLPTYDAQELRRRIPVCFTIGELYRLAERLQVRRTPAWTNNPQEAARDIVRHFEQSGALAFLVEALREAKPLVEWPDPLPPPARPMPSAPPPAPRPPPPPAPGGVTQYAAPSPGALEVADTSPDAPGDRPTPISMMSAEEILAATGISSEPGRMEPAGAPAAPRGAPAGGGFAPAVMPHANEPPAPLPAASIPTVRPLAPAPTAAPPSTAAAPTAPPPSTAPAPTAAPPSTAAAPTAPAPSSAPAYRLTPPSQRSTVPAWPGTVASAGAAPAKKPIPLGILIGAGAALLIGAVLIAFFAGRATSGKPTASGSGAGSGTTSATGSSAVAEADADQETSDEAEIAQHAADAMGASLQRVAKQCQIEVSSLQGRSLFYVAYQRCGPLPPSAMNPYAGVSPPTYYVPAPPPPDADPPAPPTAPTGTKPRTGGGNNKLQRVDTGSDPAPTSGTGCLSACKRSHSSCTSKCGAEPKQSSQYDAYQACLSGCLKSMAQCKQTCN